MRLNNCCNDRCRGGFLVCFGVVLSILFGVFLAVLFALCFIPFNTLIALSIVLVPTIPIIVLVGFGAAFFALTLVGLIALLICLVFDDCCR